MTWYAKPSKTFNDLLALTDAEREALTPQQARAYVRPDTLELARWKGLLNSGKSPYEALLILEERRSANKQAA